MKKNLIYIFIVLFVFISRKDYARDLDEIQKSGVLYVAFTESGLNSVNYKIALEFAKFLNVEMKVVPIEWNQVFSLHGKIPPDYITNDSISYTPDALRKADIICGTIYELDWRKKFFDYAGIMSVSDLLVLKKQANKPSFWLQQIIPEDILSLSNKYEVKNYNDLKGLTIAFLKNSSYETNIKSINRTIGGGINFVYTQSEEESQNLVKNGNADGFIAVSYVALQFIKNNPEYKLAFPVSKPKNVGWAIEKGNNQLKQEINNFFETIHGNGIIHKLFKEYFGVNYSTYLEIINSYAESQASTNRDLDEIIQDDKIVIALRDVELVYHKKGKKQFNHYLAEEFAKYLGVDLEIVLTPSFDDYFKASDGKIYKDSAYIPEWFKHFDIACDLFIQKPWRNNKIDIIPFFPSAYVVVGRKDTKIFSVNDLHNLKALAVKGSTTEELLKKYAIENIVYGKQNKLLDDVASGKADFTVVTYDIYSIQNFKNLEVKFILGDILHTGWAIKKNQPKLRQKILEFLEYARYTGILDDYFKMQTGIMFRAAENYLTALHQAYQPGIFPFVEYGSDQGLPQEDVLCAFQDRDGYIWFGNYSGAVKFNGRYMRTFNTQNGLAGNTVLDIKQDEAEKIYFATLNGISVFDGENFVTIFDKIPFKHIYIDAKNNKWFYGDNGVFILDNENFQKQLNKEFPTLPYNIHSIQQDDKGRYTFIASGDGLFVITRDNEIKKLNNYHCYTLFFDSDGYIWLSTNKGLFFGNIYDYLKNRQKNVTAKVNLKGDVIRKITQSSDGSIWLISNNKAYQIFTLNQKPIIYDRNIGLGNHRILSFLIDKENNIWFGFSGGIQKLTNKSLRILHPEIINTYITNILQDKKGRIWFGLNNGLYYWHDKLFEFSKDDKYPQAYVVGQMKNGNLVAATNKKIVVIDVNSLKIIKKINFDKPLLFIDNIFISSNDEIFLLTGVNGVVYYLKNFDSKLVAIENMATSMIYQLAEYQGKIVGGGNLGLVLFNGNNFELLKRFDTNIWTVKPVDSVLYLGTGKGLYKYTSDTLMPVNIKLPDSVVNAIEPSHNKGYFWIGTNKGFSYCNLNTLKTEFTVDSKDGLPGDEIAINALLSDDKHLLWIGTYHGLAIFDLKKKNVTKHAPNCRIERILLNGKEIKENIKVFKHDQNNFVFELTGLSFKDENSLIYQFYMHGLANDYVASKGKNHIANYQNLPPGKYRFYYRAKGKDGIWSYYRTYDFEILKPFWQEWWFRILSTVLILLTLYTFVKMRERALRKRNEHLEQLVHERTAEIERQKDAIEQKNIELEQQAEEIMAQRDEIEIQRNIAMQQRDEIARHQKDIMDSIYYAKRIQTALLPPRKQLIKYLPQHFILYRPRDIVSGDFYWFKRKGSKIFIVAADCTGHGVPGAFMSMLGSAFLNEIVSKYPEDTEPGTILNDLRYHVVEALHQTGKIEDAKDGMDIAFVILDINTKVAKFSGAFNPLFLVRNGEIFEYKADRMPIAISDNLDKPFTSVSIQLQKGDMFYIFSDGYASQFGGKKGKKFMTSRLKKLILSLNDKTMQEQKIAMEDVLDRWMDGHEQVDDILVIGVKVL